MSQDNQHRAAWWGQYSFDTNQTALWEIGPLRLAIARHVNEWQIGSEPIRDIDPDTPNWQFQAAAPDIDAFTYANVSRHTSGETAGAVWLRPILADRPLISRPVSPLYVPTGETATIFVRSPLWLRIEVGHPLVPIQELPILRPSDTWFGPSTMEGELCYASLTSARLNLENLLVGPHHSVTRVTIQNRASTQLLVERLNLPVPYLALYEAAGGLLWTQQVTMTRSRNTAMADMQIVQDPPEGAGPANLLSEPRQTRSLKTAVYTFGTLFRG